jgi:hypothetical protein
MWQNPVEEENHRKEDYEMERVEEHFSKSKRK